MSDTDRRIKAEHDFAAYKASDRRERIRREVERAVNNLNNGDSMLYDQLCWGAAVTLPDNATQEQKDAKADLIKALLDVNGNGTHE